MKYAAIANWAQDKTWTVSFMCEHLGLTRSGYYKWRKSGPSRHDIDDQKLLEMIKVIWAASNRPGWRRVRAGLRALGWRVGPVRVHRLMRVAGLQGRHQRAYKKTTIQGERPVDAPDLIGRDFSAEQPNTKWCGDITYIKTWKGWAYLATVIDLHSRKLVGWAIADNMETSLIIDALRQALHDRKPPKGVVFRPGQPVHFEGIREVLPQEARDPLVGAHGNLFRQCGIRIVQRNDQERTDPHHALARHHIPASNGVRMGRDPIQPQPQALLPRLLDNRRVRTRI